MKVHKTSEQIEQEQIEKATAIQDMVENHPGWKALVDVIENVIEREKEALAGQAIDNSYYKKIGFTQMYLYCKEIPNFIKDKVIRRYLMTQGRMLGAKTFLNSPKLFFDGLMKAKQRAMKDEIDNISEKEYNEKNLR